MAISEKKISWRNGKITFLHFINLGPPENFCKNKADGNYANPKNPQQFFTCTDNVGSLCQFCPPTLVFRPKCNQCMRESSQCKSAGPKTTTAPTIKKSTKHFLYE